MDDALKRLVSVTAAEIRFGNGLTYRRAPWPPHVQPVPVREFGRPA